MKYLPELEAVLKADGSPELATKALALAKPGVLLQKRYETISTERAPLLGLFKRSPRQTRRGLAVAPGASRLGGLPELPEGQPWPTSKGKPMQFLAQINCTELNQYRDITLLPDEGALHFFQAANGMESLVTLTPDSVPLKSTVAPGDTRSSNFVLPQFSVEFGSIPTFPEPETKEFDELGLSEEDAEVFFNGHGEILEMIRREQHALHQIGGYPVAVQGDVFTECESIISSQEQMREQTAAHARQWRLLLQFDTDDDLNVMWGDAGRIYFCICEDDLRTGRFDKVYSTMQCC